VDDLSDIKDYCLLSFNLLMLNPMGDPDGTALLVEAGANITTILAAPKPDIDLATIRNIDAVILRLPGIINAELLERMPMLKVIGTAASGIDNIDLISATTLGIPVVNCPYAGTEAVAEHAVGMMLGLAKNLRLADALIRKDGWSCREHFVSERVGSELFGKTLGIVGLGSIGERVAEICRLGFQMRICSYSPTTSPEKFQALQIDRMDDITELCETADFTLVSAPANSQTRHLIGAKQFSVMPPHAFLINISRGQLVDYSALLQVLQAKRIAGAGLDVFETEPLGDTSPLYSLDNVILTPHVAGASREAHLKRSLLVARQVLQVLAGEKPAHIVNPLAWQHRRRVPSKTKLLKYWV